MIHKYTVAYYPGSSSNGGVVVKTMDFLDNFQHLLITSINPNCSTVERICWSHIVGMQMMATTWHILLPPLSRTNKVKAGKKVSNSGGKNDFFFF